MRFSLYSYTCFLKVSALVFLIGCTNGIPEFNDITGQQDNPVSELLKIEVLTTSTTVEYLKSTQVQFILTNVNDTDATELTYLHSGPSSFVLDTALSTCTPVLTANQSCTVLYNFNGDWLGEHSMSVGLSANTELGEITNSASTSIDVVANGSLNVLPLYPSSGVNWNDYVSVDIDKAAFDKHSDTPCTASTEKNWFQCLHGGELKKVEVPLLSSCVNLDVSDSLNAFNWSCHVNLSGFVELVSKGLKPDKRLADLIDPSTSTFKANKIQVLKGGDTIFYSTASKWWSNPVVKLDHTQNTEQLLTGVGTVYFLIQDQTIPRYIIQNDKISLVIMPGAELQYVVSSAEEELVKSVGNNYLWIEGDFNGVTSAGIGPNYLVYFQDAKFMKIRKATFTSAFAAKVSFVNVDNSVIEYVNLTNKGEPFGGGIQFRFDFGETCTGNQIAHVVANGNHYSGIHLERAYRTSLYDIVSTSNDGNGIYVEVGDEITGVGIVNASNGLSGLRIRYAPIGSTWHSITTANNSGYGIQLESSATPADTTIVNASAVNNGQNGIHYSAPWDNNLYFNLASLDNGIYGIHTVASNSKFSGVLKVGSNNSGSCNVAGAGDGLFSGNCSLNGIDGDTDYGGEPSDAILRTGATGINSFIGPIVVDDIVNALDTSIAQVFVSISDWLGFESPYRYWAKDAFISPINRGRCESGACRVHDVRLAFTDTVLRNTNFDGDLPNSTFVPAAICPLEVHGNESLTDLRIQTAVIGANLAVEENAASGGNNDTICDVGEGCRNRFLTRAIEIVRDYVGDDDGLCEDNEACIYSPNFGAYQGHGELLGPCIFQDGNVSGVKMYSFEHNGI